jgi:GAF domain-containing protein
MRTSGHPFATSNSVNDARLTAHAARTTVLSYSGVPVIDVKGEVIGSLCFYDLQPRDVSQLDETLMASVSRYLSLGGLVPSYDLGA